MREVSGKAVRLLLEVLEDAKIPVDALTAHFPVAVETLRDPATRVDWDAFIAFVDAVEVACRDKLSLEDIGARMLRVPSFHFLRLAGQLVMSPRQLYTLADRLVAPAMFSNVTVKQEWLPSGRLVVTGEIAPGYRESQAYFRICHANVIALPRLLDLPPSKIEEQAFSGRRSRLILLPPASHTIATKVRRGVRAAFALGGAFRGFARQQDELDGSVAALRTSRHELRQLIERLPEGVLIHRGGTVAWANASILESLGYRGLEDIVGRNVLEFLVAEDRPAIETAMASAQANEVTDDQKAYRVMRPDGTTRQLESGTAQHVEFEGAPARLVVLRDVTEQHRLRDQLALAERMALLGRLAAGVAHEINNPLAYAHASLEVGLRKLSELADPRTAKIEESLARAREGTERVRGIVRDLKMLSRADDATSEAVDLAALLDSTLALAANAIEPKARVIRRYGDAPRARATRGRLGQLFLNLLLNAVDAIPEGNPDRHEIRVTITRDAAGRAIVEIADTGIGIDPDVASRVFDPFFTTKAVGAGTGLGLAICHRITTQLGGEITFESTPGRGSAFRVALPATVADPVATPTQPRDRGRGRVLVIDDEPELLRSIDELIAEDHEVVTVSNGRQALDLLQADRGFDVILTDLMMADVTGMDVFEAVRVSHPGLEHKFVFMTGGAFTTRSRSMLASVPNRCIEKPFDGDELLRAVGELVAERA